MKILICIAMFVSLAAILSYLATPPVECCCKVDSCPECCHGCECEQ